MKLTKTWLSYIIWVFFSIIFFTNIGIAAIEIGIRNEMADFFMPMLIMYGGTMAGILILIGIYKLIEKYLLPKFKSDGEAPEVKGFIEWFAFAIVIFVAVAVRVIAIISATGQLEGTTVFYDYAIGSVDTQSFAVHNNATYVYCGILGFVLSFLGHLPTAAMSVQAGIQIITIIATYFALKKALGRMPAWVAVIMMSFLPGSFFAVRVCTPDGIIAMFFALYLLAFSYLGQANREQKIKIGAHSVFYILIGVFAAFLTYLDWTGVLAYIIGIVVLLQYKNEDAWLKIQKPLLQIVWFSAAYILAVFLMLWFLSTGGVDVGPASVMEFVKTFIPAGGLNLMIMSPHKGYWDALVLFIFSGLWFVGFLRTKNDKAFPYVFMIVFLTIASFVGVGAYDYSLFGSYLWIMLSTVGILSVTDFRKNERDIAVAEKTKENNEKRKAERERKRAEAAGEKSISLDDIHDKKRGTVSELHDETSRSVFGNGQSEAYIDGSNKKSYGIGRKTETVTETNNITEIPEETEAAATQPVEHTPIASSSVISDSDVSADSKYNIVKKVDRPPLGVPSSMSAVQPQYGYSAGSRSRRSFRTPSKSTFTPEDLERISRYTGVNYLASQTVSIKEEPEIAEENSVVVNEAVYDNIVNTAEVVPENVEIPASAEFLDENSILSADEPIVSAENIENADVSVSYIELEPTESAEKSNTTDNVIKAESPTEEISMEKTSEPEDIPTLAPYVSPSRRHFRHPSKSTFTPEELENISRYTGVNYVKPAEKIEDVSADKKAEILPGVQSENVVEPRMKEEVKNVSTVTSLNDVKTNIERKPKMIRNPLPGPKPHVAKELSYDYNPKPSEMEFDIVDMKGKDFFDL